MPSTPPLRFRDAKHPMDQQLFWVTVAYFEWPHEGPFQLRFRAWCDSHEHAARAGRDELLSRFAARSPTLDQVRTELVHSAR